MTGADESTEGASRAPAPASSSAADARARVLGWARRSIDLVPTSWLITGAGAVLLAATALFGGLEAAAVDPIPVVAVGDEFVGSDIGMTVTGVELRDDRGEMALIPDAATGERILVVEVDAVNRFMLPRSAASDAVVSPTIDGIGIEGLDEKAAVFRAGEEGGTPILQPDVPVSLLLGWIVGPDDFHDGDEITVTLPDSTHGVGSFVVRGDYWDGVRVGATVQATIDEVVAP